MCGITGYVGERRAAPILLDCLKKLEYRGYDSAGIATIDSKELFLKKDKGCINEIEQKLKLSELPGKIGIGHTRWATHGIPDMKNAHPHTSCDLSRSERVVEAKLPPDNKIAVAHNGIIENYLELKNDLIKKGHKFNSETDTEVFAHLIEENLKTTKQFEAAFVKSVKQIHGSYAFVAINSGEPDKIFVARNKAPLIIGLGKGENFVASDITAFLSETKKAIILEDGEYAVVSKDSFSVKEISSGKLLNKMLNEIKWSAEAAEKAGYEYFALKEINEIPQAVEHSLANMPASDEIIWKIKKFRKIVFVAAGTSYHAALIGKYLLSNLCGIKATAALASEFSWSYKNFVDNGTLIIAISQSGETADTLLAVKEAKASGAKVLAITNVTGSSLTREADYNIHMSAGPEIAVIATKTFVAQLIILYYIAFKLAGLDVSQLKAIPALQKLVLKTAEIPAKECAEKIKSANNAYFLGRGICYPLSREGALKLKEISYIHAEGMPAGELKHGTLSLIESGVPVVFSLTPDSHEKTIGNMQEVKARGGFIIAITNESDKAAAQHANIVIKVPDLNGLDARRPTLDAASSVKPQASSTYLLYPLLQIIPMQLLAYYTTILRGLNPDKPRNLAKSVTVE